VDEEMANGLQQAAEEIRQEDIDSRQDPEGIQDQVLFYTLA